MGRTMVSARFVLRGYLCRRQTGKSFESPTFLSCDTLFAITRNLTLKKFILILLLLCVSSLGFADEPRQQWKFWSSNYLFLLRPTEQTVDTVWTDQGYCLSHKEVKWGIFKSFSS